MHLGFDISTSVIGIYGLDENCKTVYKDTIDFKNKTKFPTLLSKAQYFSDYLKKHFTDDEVETFCIEEALQMFQNKRSSAKVISILMKFNGICSWILYSHFGMEPFYLGATTARKKFGLTIPKGIKAKKFLMNHLHSDPEFKDNIKYTKTGSVKPNIYDLADAYVIAKAHLIDYLKTKP